MGVFAAAVGFFVADCIADLTADFGATLVAVFGTILGAGLAAADFVGVLAAGFTEDFRAGLTADLGTDLFADLTIFAAGWTAVLDTLFALALLAGLTDFAEAAAALTGFFIAFAMESTVLKN